MDDEELLRRISTFIYDDLPDIVTTEDIMCVAQQLYAEAVIIK